MEQNVKVMQEKAVLVTVILALICSCVFHWVDGLKTVSAGVSIVICTVAAAGAAAICFPVEPEEE